MLRHMLVSVVIGSTVSSLAVAATGAVETGRMSIKPRMERCEGARFEMDGWISGYLDGVIHNWLMIAPDANPAMLQMFRDRDRTPPRDLLPWSGEFAGKYLTGAVQVYRLTHDPGLKEYLSRFVADLIACQDEDGYLGPWPKNSHLTGKDTWDAWGHYHVMLGLLLWHQETGDLKALHAAKRIADLLCNKFLGAKPGNRLVDLAPTEINLAPIHSLCILYRETGEDRYLSLAKQILDEFAAQGPHGPLSGDWFRMALAGREFFESPKPRWESLHSIMGIAELYWITGDPRYRQAFEHIWWSIVKLDRHNNGGFSSAEQAQGNPYHQGAIETCCTIAWTAMSVEMLRMTGDSVVADEIELSTLNSIAGLHSPTGRWVTYNTPMDGVRKSSAQDIVFQAREGSPELNCCSVNGARGFGMVSDWAVMRDNEGIVLNYYGPSTMTVSLPSGTRVELRQKTDYPAGGHVKLQISPPQAERFVLKLRVPYWSRSTRAMVNGQPLEGVTPGRYLTLDREWAPGDVVELDLDMTLHFWVGEKECRGKTSVFRGPILLTYDRRYNDMDPGSIPALDAAAMVGKPVKVNERFKPIELLEFTAAEGRKVRLCDFAHAGQAGTPYVSWLQIKNAPSADFSRSNPLRSARTP